ncbi:MAG: ABC-type transport auxiliary lipoprotein family protein [Acidobacteriota bacterium]|nr:ABC-type transport auxiliary lipoprotein family protein [Acidobacteriota bacterium]
MKAPTLAGATAFAFLLSLAGCAKQPPTHYYLLESAAPPTVAASADGVRVGIRSFAVDSPYDEAGIVYRVGSAKPEIGLYAYHEWAAPLSRMLPRLFADALSDTAGVATVEPVVPGGRYDFHLDGRLIALEEVDIAERQEVRLRMTLQLSRDGTEIWRRSVAAEGSVTTDKVARIVELMNEVLLGAVEDLRPDLEAALGAH